MPYLIELFNELDTVKYIATNSQVLFHDGSLLHSKIQYTTLDYSKQLYNTRSNSTSSLTQLHSSLENSPLSIALPYP
jgi:hypothetical protein